MAKTMKCDRCGDLYEHHRMECMGNYINGISIVNTTKDGYRMPMCMFDLCPKCCGMITGSCPGIDKHYILSESDKELLLRDIMGFMSYIMVYFTINGPSDFIRDFVNFDLFLDNCDDIFRTILEPCFIKLESVNYGGDIYQKCHVMINYPALSNMYTVYKDSSDENWQDVCKWISSLSYSDLIISRAGD